MPLNDNVENIKRQHADVSAIILLAELLYQCDIVYDHQVLAEVSLISIVAAIGFSLAFFTVLRAKNILNKLSMRAP